MNNQKQISNTPMILGIIGGILGLPASFCAGACAAGMGAIANADNPNHAQAVNQTADIAAVFLWIGLIASVLGLVSAFLYKKNPKRWGGFMVVAGVLFGITLVTFNFLSLVVCVLLLIGGVMALTQKQKIA